MVKKSVLPLLNIGGFEEILFMKSCERETSPRPFPKERELDPVVTGLLFYNPFLKSETNPLANCLKSLKK